MTRYIVIGSYYDKLVSCHVAARCTEEAIHKGKGLLRKKWEEKLGDDKPMKFYNWSAHDHNLTHSQGAWVEGSTKYITY